MKSKNNRYQSVFFIDVMMNGLAAFIGLFVLAFLLINQKEDDQAIPTDGKYLITVNWDGKSKDDVDTYVMDPVGNVVYFNSREKGLMHLERDDRGEINDSDTDSNGESITVLRNEERVVIRGVVSGEYLVNVHMYRKRDQGPTTAKITLIKLVGHDEQILEKERILEFEGDEETAFRFTLNANEQVVDTNELPRSLVRKQAPLGGDSQ